LYHPKALLNELQKLENKDQIATLRAGEAALYRKSLYLTSKYLLGYEGVNWRTHGEMIQTLEGESKRKLVVMPRGTFKTSIAVVAYSIWRFINDFNIRIVIDSELFTNSKRTLREISMHLQSPRFVELFGDPRGQGVWNESEILCAQRTSVKKEATFTCSGMGAQKTGQHYQLALLDDMNSPQNSNTPENRAKVIDHYRYYQSILDPGGELAVVGTRYHEEDLIGYCLRNEIFIRDEPLID
jgi:hypothetical protein